MHDQVQKLKPESITSDVYIIAPSQIEYIAHIFKKETNMTVTEYINHRKMLLAKDMIRGTSYPLHEISDRLGYEGYSYFSRVFKKEFGIAPGHLKRIQEKD